jgi:transposase
MAGDQGMKPYSMDLRVRVVAACDAREGTRQQIAKRFGVSERWVRRLLQRRKETGSIAALPQNPGRKPKLNERQMGQLQRLVQRHPDATLRELKEGLKVKMTDRALLRALGVLGFTLKKSRSRQPSKDGPT